MMHHKNITRYYGADISKPDDEGDRKVFIYMELADVGDLRKFLNNPTVHLDELEVLGVIK